MKLAIGDLFSEPFRNALVYINAFIIAITKIIRAFKPLNTESETAGNRMQQFADDTEEAVEETESGGNLLDFDKFRTLDSGEDEQVSITETITAELQKQIDAYNDQLEAMGEVNNKAVEIAETIKSWFIVTDEEGNFVEWTNQAKGLGAALAAIPILAFANKINTALTAIKNLTDAGKELTASQTLMQKAFSKTGLIVMSVIGILVYLYATNEEFRKSINNLVSSLATALQPVLEAIGNILQKLAPILTTIINAITPIITFIVNIISGLVTLLDNLGLLEGALYAVIIAFVAWQGLKLLNFLSSLSNSIGVLASYVLTNLKKIAANFALSFELMSKKAKLLSVSIGMVGASLAYAGLTAWFNSMDEGARTVAGAVALLVAALGAAATAWLVYHGAMTLGTAIPIILTAVGVGVAGIQAIISGISGFAEGGITDANFIMTHENGVREWVGKQGNSTAVVNDTQMSTVMSQSVRDGVLEAMSYGAGSNENINITVQAQLDGQKIYESTRRIARKNGEKFARV